MRNGYTLIEVIIVISIISLLSTLGISSYTSLTEKARDSRRKDDMRAIATALNAYYSVNGKYPQAGGCAYGNSACYVTSVAGDAWIPALVPDYADSLPLDPINNAEVRYDGEPLPNPTTAPTGIIGGQPTPTPTQTIGGLPSPTPTQTIGGFPTATPTIGIIGGGDDQIPTPTEDVKGGNETYNIFDTLFAAFAAVPIAPWHVNSAHYVYAYGNVSLDGQSYDLTTRLENENDPDSCGYKNYKFGPNNLPHCVAFGGTHSNRVYELSPLTR
ncbi:MAG: prepilin-type N-terminal cleavage/methylation domain-containing protein [Weeksellaceae bacterium]